MRKHTEDGIICRYKVSSVARGFMQPDSGDMIAAVVYFITFHTCLDICVIRGYFIEQLDTRTAFSHDDMWEDVYVSPMPVLNLLEPSEVPKIKKWLDGLKHAPKL